jgi:hypothetical protein
MSHIPWSRFIIAQKGSKYSQTMENNVIYTVFQSLPGLHIKEPDHAACCLLLKNPLSFRKAWWFDGVPRPETLRHARTRARARAHTDTQTHTRSRFHQTPRASF